MSDPLEPCRAEAAIALDALLLALERVRVDGSLAVWLTTADHPLGLALLAELRAIEALAREAIDALHG